MAVGTFNSVEPQGRGRPFADNRVDDDGTTTQFRGQSPGYRPAGVR